MLELLLVVTVLVLHLLGLTCLALAQDKHWKMLVVYPRHQTWVAPIGWGSLVLSLLLAWVYQGMAFGSLIWLLLLPPSGLALAFILAWLPQLLWPLAKLLRRQGE